MHLHGKYPTYGHATTKARAHQRYARSVCQQAKGSICELLLYLWHEQLEPKSWVRPAAGPHTPAISRARIHRP